MYNNFLVRKREKDILSLKQIVFFFLRFFFLLDISCSGGIYSICKKRIREFIQKTYAK